MRIIDLSDRCLFRLHGPDSESYLNGQVTQDVRDFSPGEPARWACICTAKGKMQGIMLIHRRADEGGFFIDAPAELRESLALRLDRYLIADDAELTDVTGESLLAHSDTHFADHMVKSNRFGFNGYDLWMTQDEFTELKASKQDANWLSEDDLELERIRSGVPKWGNELTEDTLPPEAKLEERAISYHKGCYVGQETISRIKSVGRVNRSLTRFTSAATLKTGDQLYLSDHTGKPVAEITSAIQDDDNFLALGYLKRSAGDQTTFQTQSATLVNLA